EKLFEELSLAEEGVERTRHPRIYIGRASPREWGEINRQVEALGVLADSADPLRIHAEFKVIVPEYTYKPLQDLQPRIQLRADAAHEAPAPAGHLCGGVPTLRPLTVEEDTAGV